MRLCSACRFCSNQKWAILQNTNIGNTAELNISFWCSCCLGTEENQCGPEKCQGNSVRTLMGTGSLADDRCFASWSCVLCQLYKRVVCLQDIFEVQRTALNRRKRYTVDNPQVTYKVPEFDRRSSVPRKCLGLSWYASACDSTV